MKESDVKQQMARITQFNALKKVRDEMYAAITKITEDWKDTGPCGQGPFTGNTHESRRVRSMHIYFSETLGGAPCVEIEIPNMHISAWDLGRAMEAMLRTKIEQLNAEMEKV
jgi:hypothetical protein